MLGVEADGIGASPEFADGPGRGPPQQSSELTSAAICELFGIGGIALGI
jgi:hypothetical protein